MLINHTRLGINQLIWGPVYSSLAQGCNQEVLHTRVEHVSSLYTTLVIVIPLERVQPLLEVVGVHPCRHNLLAPPLLLLFDLGPVQPGRDVGQLQVKGYAQLI